LDSELTGPEIARELYVTLNTLRTHTKRIFTKLDVTTRTALVGLVQRTDPHPRNRRHHHVAWRSRRPGRTARPAHQSARSRRAIL